MLLAVIAVVAIVILAAVALLASQRRATLVDITKSEASGSSMFFNVTIRTSGSSIEIDQLHLDVRSVRSSITYDEIEYYNLERIPGGTTFVWDVDIGIDPLDELSFSYVFSLVVNGAQTDTSTVT